MEKETKKVDTKKLIITALLVLLTAGVVGGGVYYYQEQNFNKERDAYSETLGQVISRISELTKKEEKASETAPAVENDIEKLRSLCEADDSQTKVGSLTYMENTNGKFGNCGMDQDGGGGAMFIAKKINNVWTKVWVGNGAIEESLCDQHKIPNKMSGGTCNY